MYFVFICYHKTHKGKIFVFKPNDSLNHEMLSNKTQCELLKSNKEYSNSVTHESEIESRQIYNCTSKKYSRLSIKWCKGKICVKLLGV